MSDPLQYGVRIRVVARYLGIMVMLQSGFACVPILFCWGSGDHHIAQSLLTGSLIAAMAGFGMARFPKPARVQKNEVLVVAALTFLVGALMNARAMTAAGLEFTDAFFEATSGITTTGLSTVETVHQRSGGFLFLRSWIQWYGGLGMIAFAVALSLNPALLAARITSGGAAEDDAIGGTRPHYRRIIIVYVSLTIAGFLLIWLGGAGLFDSLALALAAVSTGGFAPTEGSLNGVPPAAAVGCLVLSVAASLPLVYYHFFYRRRVRSVFREPQWRALLIMIGMVFGGLLAVLLTLQDDWGAAIWQAGTMTVSAQSTAGFSTIACEELPASGRILLIVSMLVGGAAGSTAGGTKLLRWLIIVKIVAATVRRALQPAHSVVYPRLGKEIIQDDEAREAGTIIFLYVTTILLIWFSLTWVGHDPLNALFDTTSAVCTVGISSGVVTHDLTTWHKLLLCFGMLVGRVEIVAWMVLLWPPTWISKKRPWKTGESRRANGDQSAAGAGGESSEGVFEKSGNERDEA